MVQTDASPNHNTLCDLTSCTPLKPSLGEWTGWWGRWGRKRSQKQLYSVGGEGVGSQRGFTAPVSSNPLTSLAQGA